MTKIKPPMALATALIFASVVAPAAADGDHDRARDLYASGDIEGLGDVLRRAAAETPGDVVGIDLVDRDGVWVYRLDILGPDGRRRVVEMNASRDDEDGDAANGRSVP